MTDLPKIETTEFQVLKVRAKFEWAHVFWRGSTKGAAGAELAELLGSALGAKDSAGAAAESVSVRQSGDLSGSQWSGQRL